MTPEDRRYLEEVIAIAMLHSRPGNHPWIVGSWEVEKWLPRAAQVLRELRAVAEVGPIKTTHIEGLDGP